MMFLDCPAHLDEEGPVRCGLPAEVRCRFTMRSTDGPVEAAVIRCPAGHYFCGAIESLTWDGTDTHDPDRAGPGSRAGRDSLQRGHDGRHGGGRSRSGDVPAGPDRDVGRPNTAPAYYLGHPAGLWITAIGPRRGRTAADHAVHADARARLQPRKNVLSLPEPLEKDGHVMAITVAEKVLIAGGVLNLALGMLLGYPITVIRSRGAPATPRYLMAAHVS